MRRERFLLTVLWLIAVLLAALWYFDVIFGFNLFAAAHWHYLSELQIAGEVGAGFYISAGSFVGVGLVGLYLLIVPWYRRIRMEKSPIGLGAREVREAKPAPPAMQMDFTRPPKLNLDAAFAAPPRREYAAPEPSRAFGGPVLTAQTPPPAPTPASMEQARGVRNMLERAGFVGKDSPSIGGARPDFWAIGSDEALVVGLLCAEPGEIAASEGGDSMWKSAGREFKSPVWTTTGIVQKLEALFLEVLEPELKVNILPFVFSAGKIANRGAVQNIWDALGVKVFDDMNVFSEFLDGHRPRQLAESEREDFDAFSDFINTVASHFDGGA